MSHLQPIQAKASHNLVNYDSWPLGIVPGLNHVRTGQRREHMGLGTTRFALLHLPNPTRRRKTTSNRSRQIGPLSFAGAKSSL